MAHGNGFHAAFSLPLTKTQRNNGAGSSSITCKIGQKGWRHEKTPFTLNCMACQRRAARGKLKKEKKKNTAAACSLIF